VTKHQVDVLVIGAGAGGLFTAALLARRGYRTLIVERLDQIGGRASTRQVDGFAVNTGALGIEIGTETELVFKEIGADLVLRQPRPGIVIRSLGRDTNISTGLLGLVFRLSTHLLRFALRLIPPLRPAATESTHEWVMRFTQNATVLGVVHNFVGSIFAASPKQLSARLFLHYLTTQGAFKKFGFPPGGTATVWSTLRSAFTRDGGEIWLNAETKRLTFCAEGKVSGAIVSRAGAEVAVAAHLVVSDIGPAATIALCSEKNLPNDYVATVYAGDQPSAIITLYFASRTPLAAFPGFACFSHTRRLCYAASFTPTCPENSPPGWYFYCGASVPHPAVGDFDAALEIELLKSDLREQFPGFDAACIIDVVVTRDEWPAQRAIAGYDLPHATPIANLWNVGDGVKQWGSATTSACAETARIVADEICRINRVELK